VLTGILLPKVDTTSLDTASNQTEYTLPTTIPANDLRRVYYQQQTGDANDNQWYELRDWDVIFSDTGSADVLVLPQLTPDRDIRLDYVVPHSALYLSTDQISELIHIDRIKYRAAELLFVDQIIGSKSNKGIKDMANYFAVQADRADLMHPVILPPRNVRVGTYEPVDVGDQRTGEVGKVRL